MKLVMKKGRKSFHESADDRKMIQSSNYFEMSDSFMFDIFVSDFFQELFVSVLPFI